MDPKSLCTTNFCGIKIDNVTNNNTKSFILKDLSLKTPMIIYPHMGWAILI